MTSISKREWILGALIILVAGICVRLGFWQLSRLGERRAQNAIIETRLSQPPITLSDDEFIPDEIAYRRVHLQGDLIFEDEILLKNRALQGRPGYHLVTPLSIAETEWAVLVDRGWIPIEDGNVDSLTRYTTSNPVALEGIIRLSQPEPRWSFMADKVPGSGEPPLLEWLAFNVEGIQQQISYPLLPVVVEQSEPLAGVDGLPLPQPEIDLSEGPHLSYTIQWFSFGAIALIGGMTWLRRRLKRMASASEGSGQSDE
jgi:surfeit locus 1 family protein